MLCFLSALSCLCCIHTYIRSFLNVPSSRYFKFFKCKLLNNKVIRKKESSFLKTPSHAQLNLVILDFDPGLFSSQINRAIQNARDGEGTAWGGCAGQSQGLPGSWDPGSRQKEAQNWHDSGTSHPASTQLHRLHVKWGAHCFDRTMCSVTQRVWEQKLVIGGSLIHGGGVVVLASDLLMVSLGLSL